MPNETFKQEKLTDFTVIRNAIFKDYRLSAKAVGVACKLLSLPPTWDYSVRGIVALFSDGESSIRSALSELEKFWLRAALWCFRTLICVHGLCGPYGLWHLLF